MKLEIRRDRSKYRALNTINSAGAQLEGRLRTFIDSTQSYHLANESMNSYPPELLAQLAPVMFVAGLGTSPPSSTPESPGPKGQDLFVLLANRLKDALLAQRKVAIWQPDKSKTFQVVLVDPVRNVFCINVVIAGSFARRYTEAV